MAKCECKSLNEICSNCSPERIDEAAAFMEANVKQEQERIAEQGDVACACGGEGPCQCGGQPEPKMAECKEHGVIAEYATPATGGRYGEIEYKYCQYCLGEWLSATFPVTTIE